VKKVVLAEIKVKSAPIVRLANVVIVALKKRLTNVLVEATAVVAVTMSSFIW